MGARAAIAWLGLGAAMSPVLFDLLRHLRVAPEDLWILVSPLLMALCVFRSPPGSEGDHHNPRFGLAIVLLAVLVELVGIAGDSWSIARLGLPMGIVGLAVWLGRPVLPIVLLSFWMIPLPGFIYGELTPHVETALAAGIAGGLGAVGIPVTAVGPLLSVGDARFELLARDSGVVLAAVLGEIGWYSSYRRGKGLRGCLGGALRAAPFGFVLQPLAAAVGVTLVAFGFGGLARPLLSKATWILSTLVGVWWVERRERIE